MPTLSARRNARCPCRGPAAIHLRRNGEAFLVSLYDLALEPVFGRRIDQVNGAAAKAAAGQAGAVYSGDCARGVDQEIEFRRWGYLYLLSDDKNMEVFAESVARWVEGKHDSEYTESWPGFRTRCLAGLVRAAQAAPDESAR